MKMDSTFSKEYKAITSQCVTEEDYCLDLVHAEDWSVLAVSSSDKKVSLMDTQTLTKTHTLEPHTQLISGIKFSRTDSNILWTSSADGFIKMWDLRSSQCEKELQGNTEKSSVLKPITCFDVSNNERILCGGTELTEEGAFVLYWDIRGKEVLGSYFESSTDDITQVLFNPNQDDVLATASGDGLINIFDISQSSESDALTYSLNVEVIPAKLFWLSHGGKYERLATITDVETLQYWDIREAAPKYSLSREAVASAIKCPETDDNYIVSVMESSLSDDPLILAGYHGDSDDDYLRTLRLDLSSGSLCPHGSFVSRQPQRITRTALYHPQTDTFYTGGECGVVRLWKHEVEVALGKELKTKKTKQHRSKPY